MNYIHKLETEVLDLKHLQITRAERIQEFRQYLLSSKFDMIQSDGSRGDLIATSDVFNWLRYIENAAIESV
jgi:hypothetical protein